MLQTRKPLAAPSPVSLSWATAGVNSWHLFQKRLKNVWSMYSMYSMSMQENLQSSIRCLTRPKNVSPEAQGTTHLETTLWLSPHKDTSWIRMDKLRIELQERWTSTICFQSCVSSRLHRWIGELVAEIRCSFVEGQRSRFAAQACITSWNCMQKTVSASYIYIYHTYTYFLRYLYSFTLQHLEKPPLETAYQACLMRKKKNVLWSCNFPTSSAGACSISKFWKNFTWQQLAVVELPLMRSSKMESQWTCKIWILCVFVFVLLSHSHF